MREKVFYEKYNVPDSDQKAPLPSLQQLCWQKIFHYQQKKNFLQKYLRYFR